MAYKYGSQGYSPWGGRSDPSMRSRFVVNGIDTPDRALFIYSCVGEIPTSHSIFSDNFSLFSMVLSAVSQSIDSEDVSI
jgi:hypothetical protein